mmetsp:Transcript_36090/g.39886  ORF Transcript_36090/g.39886 Transcript_36090/m.39886 type:complete len:119 (+) Transcript_36090:112-468(+)
MLAALELRPLLGHSTKVSSITWVKPEVGKKIEGLPKSPPMASYKKDDVRLNFWLSTGTVGSYLNHPRQGKTQLFRRTIVMSEARKVFDNPRIHTDKGYHKKSDISCKSNSQKRGTKRS